MATSIGSFTFVSLSPYPKAPQARIDIETRPGRDGATLWNIGTHPDPFVLHSLRDCSSQADAQTAAANYQAAVGGAPLTLVLNGVTWGWQVLVLDVEPLEVIGTVYAVGGVLGSSAGLIRAKWTLLPWVV